MSSGVPQQASPFLLSTHSIGNYTVLLASPDMASQLTTLVNEGYCRERTRRVGTLRYGSTEEVVGEILKLDTVAWLVLQDPSRENTIIGSLELAEEAGKYKINAFAIDKSYSGQGLGPQLLDLAESLLKTKDIANIYLEVVSVAIQELPVVEEWTTIESDIQTEADPLADFYQRQGFEFTGVSVLTPTDWQEESRKDQYVGRVYFREMCKALV